MILMISSKDLTFQVAEKAYMHQNIIQLLFVATIYSVKLGSKASHFFS